MRRKHRAAAFVAKWRGSSLFAAMIGRFGFRDAIGAMFVAGHYGIIEDMIMSDRVLQIANRRSDGRIAIAPLEREDNYWAKQPVTFHQRSQRTVVVAILWAWFAIAAVNIALSQIGGFDLKFALTLLLSSLCGIGISLALHRVMVRLARSGREVSLPGIVAVALGCGALLWTIDVLVQAWAGGHPFLGSWPSDYFMRLRLNLVYFAILFVLQGAGCKLLWSELTLEIRERQLLEAKLTALRFQLNPHFVFNTLNAVSTLVAEAGVEEAEEMIARLSDFLRMSLASDTTQLVPLAAEIDLSQAYLQIESVRFADRLAVRYACEPGLAEALVPSMILQPLVENAVKYAVAPSKDLVTISIEAMSHGADLLLVVKDDGRERGSPAGTSSTGVGLRNVAARLDALYAAAGRIEVAQSENGYTATMRFPLSFPSND